jgi:hypothetical protein
MTTIDQARALALALPETEERAHMDHPDFRVGGRVFAGFPRPGQMSLRLDAVEQAAAIDAAPGAVTPAAGAWGRQGWTLVELERIAPDELGELLQDAWCGRAPKRLVDAYVAQRG